MRAVSVVKLCLTSQSFLRFWHQKCDGDHSGTHSSLRSAVNTLIISHGVGEFQDHYTRSGYSVALQKRSALYQQLCGSYLWWLSSNSPIKCLQKSSSALFKGYVYTIVISIVWRFFWCQNLRFDPEVRLPFRVFERDEILLHNLTERFRNTEDQ